MSDIIEPGMVVTGESGHQYEVGDVIGVFDDSPCDASLFDEGPPSMSPDGRRCRCTVCARCGHHTGNNHQGHYWRWCKVTGTMREFHLCCKDPEWGCELERDK